MDYKNYVDKKAKGLITLSKVGDAFAVSTKKFNPETGDEMAPEVLGVSVTEAQTAKESLQAQIADIDTFITDCNSLQ